MKHLSGLLLALVLSWPALAQPLGSPSGESARDIPTSGDTLGIRGLEMDMDQDDAIEQIRSAVDASAGDDCQQARITAEMNPDLYLIGDALMLCRDSFVFYDKPVPVFAAVFAEGKLKYLTMEDVIAVDEDSRVEYPAFFAALAEKFDVHPGVFRQPTAIDTISDFVTSFKGDDGEEIELSGIIEYDLSGTTFNHLKLRFMAADFAEHREHRQAMLKAQVEERARKDEERARSNL